MRAPSRVLVLLGFLLLPRGVSWGAPTAPAPGDTPGAEWLIRPGRLLEIETGELRAGWALRVRGERIAAVGPLAEVGPPGDATVLDLPDATLLPGLVDAHVHLIWAEGLPPDAAEAARLTLEAGFTTVRSCGAPGGGDLRLRAAIAAGELPGPRIAAAGAPLGKRDGICAQVFPGEGVFDTTDQAVAHVGSLAAAGAEWVKVCAGGGVLPGPADADAIETEPATLAAVVAEAHRLGLRVAAHAQGPAAILAAVGAGVDSIEHGGLIDEAAARAMVAKGVVLVPTFHRFEHRREAGKAAGAPPEAQARIEAATATARERLSAALALGVPVALGTDATVLPHGRNAGEVGALVRLGLTPLAALRAATLGGAALLGWSDQVGSLRPGHYADVLAVAGDPLADPAALERVVLVMKGGSVAVHHAAPIVPPR